MSRKKMTEEQRFAEERRAWSMDQVKDFVKLLRKDVGSTWEWMVPRVRKALVAEAAFMVVRSQFEGTVRVEAMNQLYVDMLGVAGLGDEE